MTKRILSMVLVLCMVFTILPTSTLAQTVEPSSITSNVVVNEELHTTNESNMANDETQSSKDETTSEGEKTDQIPDNGAGLEVTTPAGGTGVETTTSDYKAGDEIPSIEGEEVEPTPVPIVITTITALGEDVATQTIGVGSKQEPNLPTELTITHMVEESPTEIAIAVTWESDKVFSSTEVAEFTYTPTITTEGYVLGENITLPQITVNVVAPMIMARSTRTARSTVAEQFPALTLGQTYYFDLSNITGTITDGVSDTIGKINTGQTGFFAYAAIPDTTLHYVPFTYVGTIDAYSLNNTSSGVADASEKLADSTDTSYGTKGERSLFVADHNVSVEVSWKKLAGLDSGDTGTMPDENLIFGKPFQTIYSIRTLSTGNVSTDAQTGMPSSNEWDSILSKPGLTVPIKNLKAIYSWGQDTYKSNTGGRTARGAYSFTAAVTNYVTKKGFRPALEIESNPEFKTITLELGDGHLGTDTTVTFMDIAYVDSYTAPNSTSLTRPSSNTDDYFKWLGNDNNTYEAGASVPSTVTTLIAQWAEPAAAQILDSSDTVVSSHPTLQEAVTAVADGQTIEVLRDIPLIAQISTLGINHAFTIDLNGKAISFDTNSQAAIYHGGTGKLTITDTGTDGSLTTSGDGSSAVSLAGNGALEITGGTFRSTSNAIYGNSAIERVGAGELSIVGGTYITTGPGGMTIFDNFGDGNTVTIGGEAHIGSEHPKGVAIQGSLRSSILIKGNATVTSANTQANEGTITHTGTGTYIVCIEGASSVTNTATSNPGYAVYFAHEDITYDKLYIQYYYNGSTGEVGRVYPEAPVAQILNTSDEVVTSHPTLQGAVTAVQDGQTIEILKDITLSATVDTTADADNYTINLGNYTINADSSFNHDLICHNGTGTLTIIGGANGKIHKNTSGVYSAINNNSTGNLTISSGTVTATDNWSKAIFNRSTGTVTVDGGTVSAKGDGGFAIYNDSEGIINVDGGIVTVTGTGRVAIQSTNIGTVQMISGTVSATSEGTAIDISQDYGGVEVYSLMRSLSEPQVADTVIVSGGSVSAENGVAINNESTGTLNISGGTVEATGDGQAILNDAAGTINISGNAQIRSQYNNGKYAGGTIVMLMGHLAKMDNPIENSSDGEENIRMANISSSTSDVVLIISDTASVTNTVGTYAIYFADEEETDFPPTSINSSNVMNYYNIAETATVGRIHPERISTISGTIKGSDTKEGIVANLQLVRVVGGGKYEWVGESTANSDGTYSFQAPNGTYVIGARMLGYADAIIENLVVNNGDVEGKNLTLKKLYDVIVYDGGRTPSYDEAVTGETVIVTAEVLNDKRFKEWSSTTAGVTFEEPTHAQTTFIMPESDVTVTATFIDREKATLSGKVTNKDTTPVNGATVKIIKQTADGFEPDTVADPVTTTADGSYSIADVPYGVYSLVVTHGTGSDERTNTSIITINAPTANKDVTLLSGKKDTKVEVLYDGNSSPVTVAADGLDQMFIPEDEIKEVEIKLVVKNVTDHSTANKADKILIENRLETDETVGIYLDAKLVKTIDTVEHNTYQPPNNKKVKIVIDVPSSLQNKESYSIVRVHNDEAATLTATYNSTYHTLSFEADKFSTYAIVYSEEAPVTPPTGGGSSGGGGGSHYDYYDIKIIEGENGSISPDGGYDNKLSVREYKDQTFTFTPDKGYIVSDVIVDGKSKGKLSQYTFENVKKHYIIEVIFAKADHVNPQTGVALDKENHFAYMSGVGENLFEPNRNITRAETVVMFSRLLLEKMDETKVYSSTFTDITGNEWYANTVGFMEQFGIVSGYEDGTFGGDKPITRAEFATIASRFDALVETDKTIFPDVADDYWAISYINSATAKGWVSGYPDGTFKPTQNITRAEAVTIVNRMLERVADQKYITVNENHIRTFGDVAESHWAYYAILEASNGHQYHRENTQETWISLD